MAQNPGGELGGRTDFRDLRYRWGALRMVNNGPEWSRTFDNGPEWSLESVFGDLQRVHGVSWDGLERSCEGYVCT